MSFVRRLPGTVVIAISSVFFALLAVVTRTLAGVMPAAQITVMRFAVGTVAVLMIFAVQGKRPNLNRRGLLFMRGLFGGGAVLSYFIAIERLGAATATVLNYSSPVVAAVLAFVFLKERPSLSQRVGLVVATVGAAVVAQATNQQSQGASALGVLAGLVSATLGGAAMTVMKKVRDDTDALTVFLAFCSVGLVMALPVALPQWVPMSTESWLISGLVGVLGLLGQILFTWGMGHTSATVGSATTQLVPVIAWSLAIGWLHESVTWLGVVGAVLTVGGVVLGALSARSMRTSAG